MIIFYILHLIRYELMQQLQYFLGRQKFMLQQFQILFEVGKIQIYLIKNYQTKNQYYLIQKFKIISQISCRRLFLFDTHKIIIDNKLRQYLFNKINGMFQMKIQNSRNKKSQPLRLFTQLRENSQISVQNENIHGVPFIQSDCSDDEESQYSHLQALKTKIQKFKEKKAMQVVQIYKETKKSIEQIVQMFKDQYSYEAMCIIDPKYKQSTQKKMKQLQEGGSTLPSSQQRIQQKQTPGFDFQATNGKPIGIDIDLRQFTLGQKQQPSSQQTFKCPREDDNFVTEFQVNTRKSTKNIKNKIMMKKNNAEFA